jgi:hypothetical protein
MTYKTYPKRAHNGTSESRSGKCAVRNDLRRRQKHNERRPAARPKTKFESNHRLQVLSETMLKCLLAEYGLVAHGDLFGAVLRAKLGEKFYQEKRADKLKVLAAGCAVYHAICAQHVPLDALKRLADSMDVDLPRTLDPCKIIVECLIDYGGTRDEKRRNRQFAARDARALSYVIRTGMDPRQVKEPEKGQNITKWANWEGEFRAQQKPSRARSEKAKARSSSTSESVKQKLPVISTSKQRYDILMNWVRMGLFVFEPKDGGRALAAIVTPITLTADQAKVRPDKVCAAILEALKKVPGKGIEKMPKTAAVGKRR